MEKCEVVQVIRTVCTRGLGTPENPCRRVVQYWDFEGGLLWEDDLEEKES